MVKPGSRCHARTSESLLLAFLTEPAPPAAAHPHRTRTVRRGESLWRLSRCYDVAVAELARVNAIADPAQIQRGQRLTVPGVDRGHGSRSQTAASCGHSTGR